MLMLREAPICAAAVAKLRTDGWRVACEVSLWSSPIDAVGVKEDQVIALESKVGFTKGLMRQLSRIYEADYVVGVVGRNPRGTSLMWCRERGIGLWLVSSGVVSELVIPKPQSPLEHHRKLLLERTIKFSEVHDETVGGVPCQKGIGVAQFVQKAVDDYRRDHPEATWKEIHAAVPSHYRTAKNMYSALRSNAERLSWRERVKAQKNLLREA